jgi:rod shape-determining protein MreB and related proteins
MIFDNFLNIFSNDIGIDLGTANTLVHVKGRGIVLSEPSVVAVRTGSREVLAVGEEAKRMLGRTPSNIEAIRPMRDGVIADFETVEKMIRYFIKKVHGNKKPFINPRMVIGIPSGITEVERRAVKESAEQAGAREIYLIEESLAAAIGADIPINEPAGNMVVDVGGGTTEVSVISLGGMVISNSIRVGGDDFDEAIMQHVKKVHNLIIGERTSEIVKVTIGNAYPDKEKNIETMDIKGRDAISGLPRILEMDSVEIRECLQEPINQVLEVVRSTLDQTPPELAADIVERGIVMTGGGSLLKGLSTFLSKETGVPVLLAENPLTCVVIGAGRFLEELDKMNKKYKQ